MRRFVLNLLLGSSMAALVVGCAKTSPDAHQAETKKAARHPDTKVVAGYPLLGPVAQPVVEAPPQSPPLELNEDTTTSAFALATSVIDTTVKLGNWLTAHPTDKVTSKFPGASEEDLCRSAMSNVRIAGHSFVRSAIFHIPRPPVGENFPSDTIGLADKLCELRTVWFGTKESDSVAAYALGDSLHRGVETKLGRGEDTVKLATPEDHGSTGTSWTRKGTTLVTMVAPIERWTSDGSRKDTSNRQWNVVLVAYAPGSSVGVTQDWMKRFEDLEPERAEAAESNYRQADSAIAWATLPSIGGDLKKVMALVRQTRGTGDTLPHPDVDSALMRALRATRQTAPTLPAPRRAAALLAADMVLFMRYATLGGDPQNPLRKSLESVGITFNDLSMDQAVQNNRPWLWEAYRLDSLGRAGHLAFLQLLAQGWTTKGGCEDGDNEYQRIIEHGEADLARGDTDPLVHLLVGSAYQTIFDASNAGDDSEYIDAKAFAPQAEAARLKAIEHFRLALATSTDRAKRREAWNKAVRVFLKRSGQPEYVCFYD